MNIGDKVIRNNIAVNSTIQQYLNDANISIGDILTIKHFTSWKDQNDYVEFTGRKWKHPTELFTLYKELEDNEIEALDE